MRALAYWAVIAMPLLLAGAGVTWAWLVILAAFAFGFPLFLAYGARKRGPHVPATIAALAVYFSWLGFVIIASAINGVPDKASDPDCDGFCFTRTAGWIIIIVVGGIFATTFSLVAYVVAGFISGILGARSAGTTSP